MANDVELSEVLSEFARTMLTDFPIQGILDHLVDRIVDVLPITSAGVTLITEGEAPRYVAASDADALRFEELQTEIGEGPCISAFKSGEAVACSDLRSDDRFPRFTEAALQEGLAAVFTFPLRHDPDVALGALDLYRKTPGDLDTQEMAAAQTLADVAAAYLLNARARDAVQASADGFERTSLHDALTGLPNRVLFHERLDHAAKRAKRSRASVAVLFLDLDGFKNVNDVYGHLTGDKLLVAVAQRLTGLARSGDTLARFSGDEFVLLCEDLADPDDVTLLATRIGDAFALPFLIDGIEVRVTTSVGVSVAGPGGLVSSDLVEQADTAMYQVKRKGGAGHQVIDPRTADEANDVMSLERDLREALKRSELAVVYQPIVRNSDGRVVEVEALLRWTHPIRGNVPALAMVAIAERSDLISDLGAWVLECSCTDRTDWLTNYPTKPLAVSVNISAHQLGGDFVTSVADAIDKTGMDPSALMLEMTEGLFIDDTDRVTTVLNKLRTCGVHLAVDDFGMGYSSIAYLGRLPIETVKLNGTFIGQIGKGTAGTTIVASITDLVHALGMTVVAKGVETAAQHAEVLSIGCDLSQGYFHARPMSAAGIAQLLAAEDSVSHELVGEAVGPLD